MRFLFLCIGFVLSISGIAQNTVNKKNTKLDTLKSVTFIVRFHLEDMDKDDAAVLKGYVINIGYEKAKSLDGKKIKVTGLVRIVKSTSERKPGQPIAQERQGPYKYIESPEIEIVD